MGHRKFSGLPAAICRSHARNGVKCTFSSSPKAKWRSTARGRCSARLVASSGTGSAAAGAAREFSYVQLRTNAVARWEYRPGSTLFLVWAHGRQASSDDNPNQPWSREYRDLFQLHPDNTFLIKMAYWLNR
jgi:hypothetical protein